MEALALMMCPVGVGCSCWVACGGGPARHASGWWLRTAHRLLRRLCRSLAAHPPVTLLLRARSWQALSDALAARVAARGWDLGREEGCALVTLAWGSLALVLALSARSALGGVVGLFAGLVAVPLWDSSRLRARQRALADEMPGVFRALAMALGSGETLTQAIEYVGVHERGHAGAAFGRAALRLRCGASAEEAMTALADELDAPGIGLLTTALVIAQRTGSPLRGLFQSSAALVERQGECERLLAVRTAQVRLSVRVVCLLPALIVGVLSLVSVDFQQGLATPAGTASVLLAALLDGVALLVIRHLMREVI